MVAIHNFTNFAWGVAIQTKQPTDVVNAFQQVLDSMGIPKQMYSDQECSFNRPDFIRLLNKHTIKHITTIAGAHTIERFNRTLKEETQTRLDALGLDRDKWLEQLNPIISKYNTVHSTTEMTPNDAKQTW